MRSRGSASGIIDQVVSIPATCHFDSTAIITAGAECKVTEARTITSYRVADPAGRLEPVTVDAQPIAAKKYEKLAVDQVEQLWIDPGLRIPLRMESSDGRVATLAEYHVK